MIAISEFPDNNWIAVCDEYRITLTKISNTDSTFQMIVERDYSIDMTLDTDEYEQDWIELGEIDTNIPLDAPRIDVQLFIAGCAAAIRRGKQKAK